MKKRLVWTTFSIMIKYFSEFSKRKLLINCKNFKNISCKMKEKISILFFVLFFRLRLLYRTYWTHLNFHRLLTPWNFVKQKKKQLQNKINLWKTMGGKRTRDKTIICRLLMFKISIGYALFKICKFSINFILKKALKHFETIKVVHFSFTALL